MEIHSQSQIQKRVMRRVYVTYMVRMLTRPRALKLEVLAVSFVILASITSLPHVWSNMPGDPLELLTFFTSAFLETEMVVQLTSLMVVGIFAWLLPDMLSSKTRTI